MWLLRSPQIFYSRNFGRQSGVLLRFEGVLTGVVVPSIMFCFGLVMTLQGVVVNFAGLAATRFFLGLCEAGAFPVYLLFQRY